MRTITSDSISGVRLAGDIAVSSAFVNVAVKIATNIMRNMEGGANLGSAVKRNLWINDTTQFEFMIHPGVTNPMIYITITTLFEEGGGDLEENPYPGKQRCSDLPLSVAGARLFTHLFDHDVRGYQGMNNDTFTTVHGAKTGTPYATPLHFDHGKYCTFEPYPGKGELQFHDEATLSTPFMFLGEEIELLYLHDHMITTITSLITMPSDTDPVIPRQAPCDVLVLPTEAPQGQRQWSQAFKDYYQSGIKASIGMDPNGLGIGSTCYGNTYNDVYLTEGRVDLGDITTLGGAGLKASGFDSIGGSRRFAALTWLSNGPFGSDINARENEIVLLYGNGACPAAIGFFHGGLDGVRPTGQPWGVLPLNFVGGPNTLDTFITPATCLLDPRLHGFQTYSASWGSWITGRDQNAEAWFQGDESQATVGNPSARDNLVGRSIWFELDSTGHPSGVGSHNGPLGSNTRGNADLLYRGQGFHGGASSS